MGVGGRYQVQVSDLMFPPWSPCSAKGFALKALFRIARAGRRGAKDSPEALGAARRDGALKMGWTKPPQDARLYGD
jgi:hypothetical protein